MNMDMRSRNESGTRIDRFVTREMNIVESAVDEMQLSDLIGTVIDSWKLVISIIFLMLLIGFLYISLAEPIYRADVLLQIEEKSKGISGLSELSELLQEESPVTAEFEILRSRMVLGAAVNNLKLDVIARPDNFPLVSLFIDREAERIQVGDFEVPVNYQGQDFNLVAGKDNHYVLYDPDGKLLFQGEVGKPAKVKIDDGDNIKLFVSELSSRPGSQFKLIKKAHFTAVNELKKSLEIAEQGKQSGILKMVLEGPSRKNITEILNEIANIYLRQSVERKSAEAEKTLVFLNKQLPILKEKVENAEAELNRYRLEKGSVDLTIETKTTLEKIVSVDALLTQLRRDREELIRQFTPEHPRIAAIDAQIADLNNELKKVDSKVKGLPGTQQEILRLTRNLEVSSALYTSLMNSAQELKIVKAGAVGNVRIVDYAAIPDEPVKPNKGLVVAIMLVLGGLLGVAVPLVRRSLRSAVEDPVIIEKKIGLPVLATIPYSHKQRKLKHSRRDIKPSKPRRLSEVVLAATDTGDIAVESLRSLRTSLYFTELKAKNNMLLVTSPGPNAGKSFLCMNLATVLADADKRVLVIDADLRKGRFHQLFGMQQRPGLSDLIAGNMDLNEVIHKTDINKLFVLTTGTIVLNPSELLMQKGFESILKKLSDIFDHIIIDSPPVLAVTDAAIIGRYAGSTLVVVRDRQSPLREIEETIKRLKHASVNLRGVVYNGIKSASSRYGYGKYYGYSYSYSDKKR